MVWCVQALMVRMARSVSKNPMRCVYIPVKCEGRVRAPDDTAAAAAEEEEDEDVPKAARADVPPGANDMSPRAAPHSSSSWVSA